MRRWLSRTTIAFIFILGILGERCPRGYAQAQAQGGAVSPRRGRRLPTLEEQLKKLTTELTLDGPQQAKVKAILDRRQMELRRVYENRSLSAVDRFNVIMAVHDRFDDQIASTLNAEQATKFETLRHREARPAGDQSRGSEKGR
jgi:hypothetical protein